MEIPRWNSSKFSGGIPVQQFLMQFLKQSLEKFLDEYMGEYQNKEVIQISFAWKISEGSVRAISEGVFYEYL